MGKRNKRKEKNHTGSNIIFALMIAIVVVMVFLLYADTCHLFQWTDRTSERYDWLSFIGSVIGGIATLMLGYVTLKQNENQNQQLKEERKKNEMLMKQVMQAPKIIFSEKQIFLDKENVLLVNFENENELLLDSIKFYSIKLVNLKEQWHDYDNKEEYTQEILKETLVDKSLECTYLAGKKLYDIRVPIKDISNTLFEEGKFYRLEFDMEIQNQANVACRGMFYILVERVKQSPDEEKYNHIPLSVYWKYSRNVKFFSKSE